MPYPSTRVHPGTQSKGQAPSKQEARARRQQRGGAPPIHPPRSTPIDPLHPPSPPLPPPVSYPQHPPPPGPPRPPLPHRFLQEGKASAGALPPVFSRYFGFFDSRFASESPGNKGFCASGRKQGWTPTAERGFRDRDTSLLSRRKNRHSAKSGGAPIDCASSTRMKNGSWLVATLVFRTVV